MPKLFRFTLLSATATIALSGVATAQTVADTVLVNGKIYTADAKDSVVEGAGIVGDHFVAVGSNAVVRKLIGPKTKVIDLHGGFAMPGLTDDHFHGVGGGTDVALANVRSMAELLDALRAGVAKAAPGAMVLTNSDWHEAQLAEHRKPTTADLDTVSSTVPIIVVRGGHSIFLNSAALAKFGITAATPVPPGGVIDRTADGKLTGEIIDTAKALVKLPRPTPLTTADLLRTQQQMNSYGVTSVRVPGAFFGGSLLNMAALAQDMAAKGTLTLRYTLLRPGPGFADGTLEALKTGPQQGDGDEWVRFDGVKLVVDGGFEGAHFDEPYEEPYGKNGTFTGITVVQPEKTTADVIAIHKLGWHVAVHAAGDEGIEQALEAFEAADKVSPIKDQRWSLEHAFIFHDGQIARIKKLNVAMSLQDHLYLAAPSMEALWGRARADRVAPANTYWKAGLLVAGGTDAPVVPPSAIWSLYFFASRDTMNAGVFGPSEALPRPQVLRMFTINYARLVGDEAHRGSIEAGKLADFAVFNTDMLSAPVKRLRDAKALATFVGGKQVYAAPQ